MVSTKSGVDGVKRPRKDSSGSGQQGGTMGVDCATLPSSSPAGGASDDHSQSLEVCVVEQHLRGQTIGPSVSLIQEHTGFWPKLLSALHKSVCARCNTLCDLGLSRGACTLARSRRMPFDNAFRPSTLYHVV